MTVNSYVNLSHNTSQVKAVEEHKKAEAEWSETRESLHQQIRSQEEQLASLEKQNESLAAKLQTLSSQVMSKVSTSPLAAEKESTGGAKSGESPETPASKGRQITRGYSLRSAGPAGEDAAGTAAAGTSTAAGAAAPERRKESVSGDSAAEEGAGDKDKSSAADETLQTPEQMINVNRFLRREKEIAETRVEILQAEVSRLKQHNEYVEKQMAQAHKTLTAERQRATVSFGPMHCGSK